ncbi:MAG: winged helix-turn-helix domain-containing protein [bacterium]
MAAPKILSTPKLERLKAKREELTAAIQDLDTEIKEAERSTGMRASKGQGGGGVILRRPNARRMNEVTVKDAIVDLLREKKKPMHYKEITETLLKEGRYKTKSDNFLSTVAITIMRDRRLKRVEPGVYTLRKGM